MLYSLRKYSLYRRVRRSRLAREWIRPPHALRRLKQWWSRGRPAPPPHDVKLSAILYLADLVGAQVLVETGTFLGDTVRDLRGRFDLIVSIELAPALAEPLQREFAGDPSVRIVIGDSGEQLAAILPNISSPTVFWLDAHYSGGPTLGAGHVPIFAELDTIVRHAHPSHAILIDDLCDFTGANGYPSEKELIARLHRSGYRVAVANNLLHALPTKFWADPAKA